VAERAAADVSVFNQDACVASRFVFVESARPEVDAFCAALAERLGLDREFASSVAPALPSELRGEVEVLEAMGEVAVFGSFDGRGLVLLSDRPVDFHPTHKTANVVMVPSLDEAVRYVNVATQQTIGVHPFDRKAALRDRLASAGAQRVCRLGTAGDYVLGSPHDAMFPLQRFVRWMGDDDIEV
jgi:hypothetical protein